MERGKLNLDIPTKIAEFEALISKVLPKKMFYRLLFRGKGLEFDSYRNFGPDEDASMIDWKASVRANSLLARQYIEERDMKVMFLIDVGDNMIFGSQNKLKCEYVAELAASLSHSIVNSGDKIGFAFFNDKLLRMNYPQPGIKQFDIFLYNLLDTYLYGGKSDFGNLIDELMETLNPSISLIVLVSDFLNVDPEKKKSFERLGSLFETLAIMVRDPLDMTLPDINKEIVITSGGGEKLVINPRIAKNAYEENAEIQRRFVKNLFQKSNIDLLQLNTKDDFAFELASFLKRRSEQR